MDSHWHRGILLAIVVSKNQCRSKDAFNIIKISKEVSSPRDLITKVGGVLKVFVRRLRINVQ